MAMANVYVEALLQWFAPSYSLGGMYENLFAMTDEAIARHKETFDVSRAVGYRKKHNLNILNLPMNRFFLDANISFTRCPSYDFA